MERQREPELGTTVLHGGGHTSCAASAGRATPARSSSTWRTRRPATGSTSPGPSCGANPRSLRPSTDDRVQSRCERREPSGRLPARAGLSPRARGDGFPPRFRGGARPRVRACPLRRDPQPPRLGSVGRGRPRDADLGRGGIRAVGAVLRPAGKPAARAGAAGRLGDPRRASDRRRPRCRMRHRPPLCAPGVARARGDRRRRDAGDARGRHAGRCRRPSSARGTWTRCHSRTTRSTSSSAGSRSATFPT